MSDIFHKSCYTARSLGYKYRTLSTNTGERKRRNSKEDNSFVSKFRELENEIVTRIDLHLDRAKSCRENIYSKLDKIDAKLNHMLEIQDIMVDLRKNLGNSENSLSNTLNKVCKIEAMVTDSASDLNTTKCIIHSQDTILEEEIFPSEHSENANV